ncbi:hypothetical protein KP509_04G092400 [Ceratopteris richardii]|nr:hypothetical protein KP509_04G092400 [Ceratopteris richardii]
MIIRGEEFPTLQAVAAARPPTPPQLSKQKDVQYKHFDKQNGTALQKMNLEEQSKVSEARQLQSGHHQPGNGNFQSNSMVLSLRPLGRPESTSSESARQKGDLVGSGSESSLQAEKNMNSGVNLGASATEFPVRSARSINPGGNAMHGFPHEESSSSASPAAGPASAQVCNSKGSGAHLDRPLSRPPSVGLETRINIIDSTHNLRPQYKTSLSSSQNNASGEERHLNVQSSSGSLWSASTGREFVTSTHKSIEHSKAFAGDPKKVVGADKMRVLPERDSPPAKEGSFKRESFASGEANPYGLIKESAYTKQMELPNDNVCKDLTWSSSLVHDVPRIEGFHSQRSFGREMHSRSFQEGAAKAIKDSNTRDDAVTVTYDRDVRDNFGRETGNVYSKDVREACTQDAQNVYSRDVREVCNQDSTQIKQLDSVHSINNDGVGSLRGQYNRADLLGGRFNANPAVLSSSNRGFVYDAHDSKFNRPQGMKDQSPVTEIHTITNTRANRMNVSSGKHDQSLIGEENIAIDHKYLQDQFADKTNIKSNNLEISNARNSRMAVPISNSMRMVNDVHDAHSGRQHTFQEDSRVIRYEDKVVDVKRVNNGTFVPSHTTQRSFSRKEATQGSVQTLQIDANKKQADEKFFRDNVNKHFDLEDERRKEAAKMKLMELEDRIARREMEGRKDEVEWKGKGPMESLVTQQHDLGQLPSNTQYFSKQMGGDSSPDLVGEDGEPGSRIVHPYVASSVSSRTHRTRESLTSHQLQGSRLVGDSEDRKVVPPRSPSSWRSELGGGPTSKLFSSPYVESGGFHHTAGGTYKLF